MTNPVHQKQSLKSEPEEKVEIGDNIFGNTDQKIVKNLDLDDDKKTHIHTVLLKQKKLSISGIS